MADRGTWKVKIASTDFALYTDSVKAEPVSGGPRIVEEPLFGAAAPKYFDGKNETQQRRFIITKEWPDNKQSWDWYLRGAHAFAGVAAVLLYHKDYSGTETSWTITGAKIEISVEEPIGVATITHLTISGGPAALNP